MKCANCGRTSPKAASDNWVKSKGKWYCSEGCASNLEMLAKHKGSSGIISGLGQMVDGAVGGPNNSMSFDNIAGGAGKVALGVGKLAGKGLIGLGKLAGKGIAKGASAVMKTDAAQDAKAKMADAAQDVKAKMAKGLSSLNPFAKKPAAEEESGGDDESSPDAEE